MLPKTVHAAFFVLLATVALWGQTPDPAHLGDEAPGLAVQADPEYKNVLVGDVLAGASYDTEALPSATATNQYTGDTRFFVQPSIAFQQTLKTVSWTVGYSPGVSVSETLGNDFQQTENVGGEFIWSPSHRFRLRLRQDYSMTTNPFEEAGRVPLLPELGGFFGPDYTNVLAYTERTTLVSNAEATVRLSAHSAIGFTGGYQSFNYNQISNAVSFSTASLPIYFIPSRTVEASAFYSQQISSRMTIGAQYALFDIYSDPEARTQANDLLLFDRWQFSPRNTLTLYVGPEYSQSHDLEELGSSSLLGMTFQNRWRPAGGMSYAWTGTRNAVEVEFVRRIGDGGGLMNAAYMMNGSVGFRSRFAQRWTAEVRLQVSNQESVDAPVQEWFRSTWAGLGITRDLTRKFAVRLDYAYVRQLGNVASSIPYYIPGNQQLVQLSLDYHFHKPMGR